jgi:hypothetical protein
MPEYRFRELKMLQVQEPASSCSSKSELAKAASEPIPANQNNTMKNLDQQ